MKPTPVLSAHTGRKQQTMLLVILLILISLLSSIFVSPVRSLGGIGTGPGGVGATDGSGTLEIWYQSDKTVYSDDTCTTSQASDNGIVACWPDQSGNNSGNFGFEAISSVSGEQPTLQTGSGETWNGHRVINWDGDDILVTIDDPMEYVTLGAFTVFAVYNASEIGYVYVHSPHVGPNNGSYVYTDVTASYSVRRSGTEGYEDLSSGWGLNTTPRIIAHHYNGTIATHSLFINGSLQTPTFTDPDNPGTGAVSSVFSIGDRRDSSVAPDTPITGNFAEVIAFNEYLNTAQRILVENYLQAKFNDSTVDNITISNDVYDGDTNANDNFDMNVAGIGQEADGSHAEAHSAGLIVQNDVGAGGFLQDNGDYLAFGHRTLVNGHGSINVPGGWGPNARYWERHWHIRVTDVVGTANGTVTLTFDFSEGGMSGGSNPGGSTSNYRLLARSGSSGIYTDIATASLVSGDQVIFSNVNVSTLTPYTNFTLGSLDAVASPTVVEMQSAAATTPSTFTFLTSLALLILGAGTVLKLRRA